MSDGRLLVAVATYNELGNLPSLVAALHTHLPAADILVVDDNSPDGTGRWCDEHAAGDPRLSVLHREGKLGLGSATIAAFRHAIDRGYDAVATMDADWSHDPAALPAMVDRLGLDGDHGGPDVVIGSRYCPGGKIEGWPLARRVVSGVTNRVTRTLLRLPIADSSGAFRVYRVDALRRIDLGAISATGYAYLEEIVWRLRHAGAVFVEHPITFRERRAGQSKVSLAELRGKLAVLARYTGRRPR